MLNAATAAQPSRAAQSTTRRPVRARAAHVQLPRELLHSRAHSALAVVLWATYEDLMTPGIGGRVPARARRRVVGEAYGVQTTAVDAARRELLADGSGGPWLARSAPLGAKRAVRHVALRRPRETGARFVRVPQWTRDLVHGGRTRPAGHVSPSAWRLYGLAVERAGDRGAFDASVRELGALLGASADTGRRRLVELEAAGLVVVTEHPGGRLSVRVLVVQEEAEEAAARYAEHGRACEKPRRDPPQRASLTPGRERQSPRAVGGTPQDAPPREADQMDAPGGPACDHVQVVGGRAARAEAGRSKARRRDGVKVVQAARIYRECLPQALRARIPEHGSRRVLRVLVDELEHRTAAELAARVAARWETWRYRPHEIGDATAVAITVVRRGYACPDVRCEDGAKLETGGPCGHCAGRRPLSPAPVQEGQEQPAAVVVQEGQEQPAAVVVRVTPMPPPVAEVLAAPAAEGDGAIGPETAVLGASLARRLWAERAAKRAAELAGELVAADAAEPPRVRPEAAP